MQRAKSSNLIQDERFNHPALDTRLHWLNPPPTWAVDPSLPAQVVQPAAPTDFWRETHYGFSDCSGQDFLREPREVCMQIRKEALDFIIEFAPDEHANMEPHAYRASAPRLRCAAALWPLRVQPERRRLPRGI